METEVAVAVALVDECVVVIMEEEDMVILDEAGVVAVVVAPCLVELYRWQVMFSYGDGGGQEPR